MDSELSGEVIQGVTAAAGIEVFLILAVAALDLSVVARCVRTDQFMPDIQFGGRFFKQRRQITLAALRIIRNKLSGQRV